MTVKLIGILLPIYQATEHYGATPIQYKRAVVEKWEKQVMARSPHVTRTRCELLVSDTSPGGGQIYRPFMRYDVALDMETAALGEILDLAHNAFALKSVTAVQGLDVQTFGPEDAQTFIEGLHDWNEN